MPDDVDPDGIPADDGERPQDPLVKRLRPDPSQPPKRVRTLAGLLGDSDRPGHRRLYFSADLSTYGEFRTEDVLSYDDIPIDKSPFVGEPATRVTLKREATVDLTRSRRAEPIDEFDLDLRLGGLRPVPVRGLLQSIDLGPCIMGATAGDVLCDSDGGGHCDSVGCPNLTDPGVPNCPPTGGQFSCDCPLEPVNL